LSKAALIDLNRSMMIWNRLRQTPGWSTLDKIGKLDENICGATRI